VTPAEIGKRLARWAFDVRSRGRGRRHAEVHLDEPTLAALLTTAADLATKTVTDVDLAEEVLRNLGDRGKEPSR
jgi:hypothetical protein